MQSLEQKGILVGEGAFGSTFIIGGLAVKIVLTKESQGYLAYARFCRMNHKRNRLLPRIASICQVGRYTLVWMEKLEESAKLSIALCQPIKRASRRHEHVNQASRLIARSPRSLAHAMSKLRMILADHPQSYWDIRSDNILFRRESGKMKMVLNDPIAY